MFGGVGLLSNDNQTALVVLSIYSPGTSRVPGKLYDVKTKFRASAGKTQNFVGNIIYCMSLVQVIV
jgi:hypothetical protein